MNEKNSEKKVIWAALAIVACQVLGLDVSTIGALVGQIDPDIAEIAKGGDGGMWAAVVAGVYAIGRSYVKGGKE